jgi:hypothetical protein
MDPSSPLGDAIGIVRIPTQRAAARNRQAGAAKSLIRGKTSVSVQAYSWESAVDWTRGFVTRSCFVILLFSFRSDAGFASPHVLLLCTRYSAFCAALSSRAA